MKFPYAAKGIRKIFTAEILSLISALLGGIGAVLFLTASGVTNKDENLAATLGLIALILIIPAVLIFIIAAIMNIVGYLQAAKDEEGFRKAVVCTVFSIFFSFGYYLFINQSGFFGWLGTAFNVISQLLGLLVVLFMLGGLINLSAKCDRPDMVGTGASILKSLVVLYIISFIMTCITRYFKETAFSTTLIAFLSGFAIILSVTVYICQLYYLGKAKAMLKEN